MLVILASERTLNSLKIFVALIALVFLLFLGCSSPVELTGDVFIVTQGGQSIKLGLVEIQVIPEATMQPFIQSKLQTVKSEIERIKAKKEKIDQEYKQLAENRRHWSKEVDQFSADSNRFTKTVRERARVNLLNVSHELKSRYDTIEKNDQILHDELTKLGDGSFYLTGLPTPKLTTKTDADGKFALKLKPGKYAVVAYSQRNIIDDMEMYYWLIWITVSSPPNRVMLSNDNLFTTCCRDCILSLLWCDDNNDTDRTKIND